MLETILGMSFGELIGLCMAGTIGVTGCLEISKFKINPWTWAARKIGRAINSEVIEKVDKLEDDIKDMRKTNDERDIKDARTRVLRFGDEVIHDVRHSKEHYDDILQDISDYEVYCAEHKEFKNDRLHLTAQLIKDTYRKCMEEHSFI